MRFSQAWLYGGDAKGLHILESHCTSTNCFFQYGKATYAKDFPLKKIGGATVAMMQNPM